MSIKNLQDNTSGTIYIGSKPVPVDRPSDQGFFSIGGGAGFSGGFGGSSGKRAKKRARARARARAEAQAIAEGALREQAQEQARVQAAAQAVAHQQRVSAFAHTYTATKAEIDRRYIAKASGLEESIKAQLEALKKPIDVNASERLQLHLITLERDQVNTLIAMKNAELRLSDTAAKSFDGHDPLARSLQDYLAQLSTTDANQTAVNQAHHAWEQAYSAAQQAKELASVISLLTEKANALTTHHAEQKVLWHSREQQWERHRQHAEQREARIGFKLQADEQARHEWRQQANTLSVTLPSSPAGGMLLTQAGAMVGQGLAEISGAVARAIQAIDVAKLSQWAGSRLLDAAKLNPAVRIVIMSLTPSELGDGELSPEQRNRFYEGFAVPATGLNLAEGQDLKSIADVKGTVELPYRVKSEPVQGGAQIIILATGGDISGSVPVINAVHDPLTDTYVATTPGVNAKQLHFSATTSVTAPSTPVQTSTTMQARAYFPEPVIEAIPAGADTRFNDCIVCIPGLPAMYLSFGVPPAGTGVVSGLGHSATLEWSKAASQAAGVAIPASVGDRLRGREFASLGAFNESMWRAIAQDSKALGSLSEVNKHRVAQGFAPYAPKEQWSGEYRELELRTHNPALLSVEPYNLDNFSISAPNGVQGVRPVTPVFEPWSLTPLNLLEAGQQGHIYWKPLIPAGTDALGPTTLPVAPELPIIYPGETADPVGSQTETLPSANPDDVNASIPGFGEDADLPSPDVLFAKPPVRPLEAGDYNNMRARSRNDGLDLDHLPSRKALEWYVKNTFTDLNDDEFRALLLQATCIAIPSGVHQKFSETYGGRNNIDRQKLDSADLKAAVDRNFDAIKVGLLEQGFEEVEVEAARQQLHESNVKQGWYK